MRDLLLLSSRAASTRDESTKKNSPFRNAQPVTKTVQRRAVAFFSSSPGPQAVGSRPPKHGRSSRQIDEIRLRARQPPISPSLVQARWRAPGDDDRIHIERDDQGWAGYDGARDLELNVNAIRVLFAPRPVEELRELRKALRATHHQDPDAQAVLDRIQEGIGLDDLIQDLRALAVFFRQNVPALERIGAKPDSKRQQAEKTAGELEGLLAGRRAGDRDEAAAIDLRNRAAVHLQDAVAEIRATGAYVFRRQPRKAVKFRIPNEVSFDFGSTWHWT